MEQGIYNLPDIVSGDTFNSIQLTFESGPDENNLTPINLTGAVIRMQFKTGDNMPPALSLTSAGASPTITILNAANGIVRINKINSFSLEPNLYYYDIEIEFTNGTIKTYLKGQVNVLVEYTR